MKEKDIIIENLGITIRKYYEILYTNKLYSDDMDMFFRSHKWLDWHKNEKYLCGPLPAKKIAFMTSAHLPTHTRTHPSQRPDDYTDGCCQTFKREIITILH